MPRYEKVEFKNKDGDILAGRLELPEGGSIYAYALFAHCFTCSKNVLAASVISRTLTNDQIAVLRFDFTGLGNSSGDFSNTNFSSNVEDLISAYEFLEENYQAPQLIIGHSLGGAAVLKVAPQLSSIKAVVTIAAPSCVGHVSHLFTSKIEEIEQSGVAKVHLGGRDFNIKKQFIDDLNETKILEGLKRMNKALLVMHSPLDEVVGIDHAQNIFMAARHPKSFMSLGKADHMLSKSTDGTYAAQVIGPWAMGYLSIVKQRESWQQEQANIPEGTVVVHSRQEQKFTQDVFTKDHKLIADEPLSVKGSNLGFNPYELLLAGLGSCTSMTLRMYADLKKIPLNAVEVSLHHNKVHAKDCEECENQTGKIDVIEKAIKLSGDLTQQQKDKLIEIAEKCPVNKTLKSEIKIISIKN